MPTSRSRTAGCVDRPPVLMCPPCANKLDLTRRLYASGLLQAKQTLAEVENLWYKQQRTRLPPADSGGVLGPCAPLPSTPSPSRLASRQSPPQPLRLCHADPALQVSVLSATSAPASNSVLGRSLHPIGADDTPLPSKRPPLMPPHTSTDNMSLLAQASLMAPPVSTPAYPGSGSGSGGRTPPRRSAPIAPSFVTPTPADRLKADRSHTWTVPASSASASSTPPHVATSATAAEAAATAAADAAVPTNYAAFWAHVGSMGGLGSSTPAAPHARKRMGRPSLTPDEAEASAKRVRVAGTY